MLFPQFRHCRGILEAGTRMSGFEIQFKTEDEILGFFRVTCGVMEVHQSDWAESMLLQAEQHIWEHRELGPKRKQTCIFVTNFAFKSANRLPKNAFLRNKSAHSLYISNVHLLQKKL